MTTRLGPEQQSRDWPYPMIWLPRGGEGGPRRRLRDADANHDVHADAGSKAHAGGARPGARGGGAVGGAKEDGIKTSMSDVLPIRCQDVSYVEWEPGVLDSV
jgi:hypothetical protein